MEGGLLLAGLPRTTHSFPALSLPFPPAPHHFSETEDAVFV